MEKIAQCTLESRNLEKFQKTGKTFNFSNCPKNVPKSNQTCLEHASRYFCRWKNSPSAPWRVEKSKKFKKWKKNQFFKIPKNVSKSVQISSEVIFSELFLTSATWRSKLVEIRKKIEKNWIPKSVLKRS